MPSPKKATVDVPVKVARAALRAKFKIDGLFNRVMHHYDGEESELTTVYIASKKSVVPARIKHHGPDKWIERAATGRIMVLDFLVVMLCALQNWEDFDSWQVVVEQWAEELRKAAITGEVTPRNKDSLLKLDSVPEDWDWLISGEDADKFIATRGMKWTCTEVLQHLLNETRKSGISYCDPVTGVVVYQVWRQGYEPKHTVAKTSVKNKLPPTSLADSETVLPEFVHIARPSIVPPGLLSLESTAKIYVYWKIGADTGTECTTASEHIARIKSQIQRQAMGFFTIDEAAQILVDAGHTSLNEAMVVLREARVRDDGTGELRPITRNHYSRPIHDESKHLSSLTCVRDIDINAYLKGSGYIYEFPAAQAELAITLAKAELHQNSSDSIAPLPVINNAEQQPLPLTTSDIAFSFAGLKWETEKKWKKPLGDIPKWLNECVHTYANRGVSQTLWNPVSIGAALISRDGIKANSVRAKFQTKPALMPWLEQWKDYEAEHFDA
jgi:hypothetical protein